MSSTSQLIGWQDQVFAAVKWLAGKIISKLTYIVSTGMLKKLGFDATTLQWRDVERKMKIILACSNATDDQLPISVRAEWYDEREGQQIAPTVPC